MQGAPLARPDERYGALIRRARAEHAHRAGTTSQSTVEITPPFYAAALDAGGATTAQTAKAEAGPLQRATDAATTYTEIPAPDLEYFVKTFVAASVSSEAMRSTERARLQRLAAQTRLQCADKDAATMQVLRKAVIGYSLPAVLDTDGRVLNMTRPLASAIDQAVQSFDVFAAYLSAMRRCKLCDCFFAHNAAAFCAQARVPVHPDVFKGRAGGSTGTAVPAYACVQHAETIDEYASSLRAFRRDDALAHVAAAQSPDVYRALQLHYNAPPLRAPLPTSVGVVNDIEYTERMGAVNGSAAPLIAYAVPLTLCQSALYNARGMSAWPQLATFQLVGDSAIEMDEATCILDCVRVTRAAHAHVQDTVARNKLQLQRHELSLGINSYIADAVEAFLDAPAHRKRRSCSWQTTPSDFPANGVYPNRYVVVATYDAMLRFRFAFHAPGAPQLKIDLVEVYVRCILSNVQWDDARWGHKSATMPAGDLQDVDEAAFFVPFALTFYAQFE